MSSTYFLETNARYVNVWTIRVCEQTSHVCLLCTILCNLSSSWRKGPRLFAHHASNILSFGRTLDTLDTPTIASHSSKWNENCSFRKNLLLFSKIVHVVHSCLENNDDYRVSREFQKRSPKVPREDIFRVSFTHHRQGKKFQALGGDLVISQSARMTITRFCKVTSLFLRFLKRFVDEISIPRKASWAHTRKDIVFIANFIPWTLLSFVTINWSVQV